MKKALLIFLAAATAVACGGCFHAKNIEQQDSARAKTLSQAGSSDRATYDSATNDSALKATNDEWHVNDTVPSMALMDWKMDRSFFIAPLKHQTAQLDVTELLQNPELPTGCESVAVTTALQTLGFSLEKTDFAENYLTYGEDVMWDYVGNPTDYDGAGIFPPGLTNCTNRYLQTQNSKYAAYNTMGVEFEDLFKLIDAGYPVVLWTTMDYELPWLDDVAYLYDGEYYYWYSLEHCVMLCGYDLSAGEVTISDPMQGIITQSIEQMKEIYNGIGKMSMTIKDKEAGSKFVAPASTVPPTTQAVSRPRGQASRAAAQTQPTG